MTIKEYISQKLKAFDISEADFCDIALKGLNLDDECSEANAEQVGKSLVSVIEGLVLAPRRASVSESGFSVAWNFDNMSKYYVWLCKRWRVEPDNDVLSLLGVSMIIDKSDIW